MKSAPYTGHKVTEDVKTAETLALEKALDDSIHMSNLITEVYIGEASKKNLPIVANESIYSKKKVKRKTMRVVISSRINWLVPA